MDARIGVSKKKKIIIEYLKHKTLGKLRNIQDNVILKEGYYLDNFLNLVNFVFERYNDLLKDDELIFVNDFKKLSVNAQRLYVRLITRRGPYFRKDKINYSEIPNSEDSLNELCDRSFFIKNPRHELEYALNTVTKPELAKFIKENEKHLIEPTEKLTGKTQFSEYLLAQDQDLIWELIEDRFTFYFPDYFEIILLFRLLFFGNTFQDFPEFILEDIGVLKYEPYEIRKEDRLFSERKVADDILFISQVRADLWMAVQSNDLEAVLYIGEVLKQFDCHDKAKRKLEKSFTEIGRFLEKFKLWDEALAYYERSKFPPAVERKIRVLDKKGAYEEALIETGKIIQHSSNEEDLEFAGKFAETIKRKLNLPYETKSRELFNTENLVLEANTELRVEEITLNNYKQADWDGFYSENVIWKGLFGLAFWDIIFMSVPEVFFNPFQRGPVDLFSPEFKERREDEIIRRLKEIDRNDWPEKIMKIYELKYNTANMLMPWNRVTKEQILNVLEIVPRYHLKAIFERMSGNLRDLKTGFPDLMLFNKKNKTYSLVEVKGPGDQLRLNQKRWLRFFETHSIPYKVANVKWK